jgi:uncharacterized membrane protein affecting hemolysin expression
MQQAGDSSSIYLKQLEQLIAEMSVGMEAIASNSVETLKESVARQEALCAAMAAALLDDGDRLRDLSHSAVPLSEEPLELSIWQSSNTIRQLNLEYDALLRHSGKAISMLSALCSNHTGRATEQQGPWSKLQTWSCEI